MRQVITADAINLAMTDLQKKVRDNANSKGTGSFASGHEILGAVTEEYYELVEAVHRSGHSNSTFEKQELLDVAAACVFGIACIDSNTVEY